MKSGEAYALSSFFLKRDDHNIFLKNKEEEKKKAMDDATDGADEQHRHLAQLLFKSASESLSINTEKGQWRSSLPPYFQRTKPVGGWGVLHRNAGAAIRRNRKKNKKKGRASLLRRRYSFDVLTCAIETPCARSLVLF